MDVAKHLGINVDTRAKKAKCPFHDDKTPSLLFSREKQICTCFSSNCDFGTADIIGLAKRYKNTTTHEALKYLSALAGETAPFPRPNTNGADTMGQLARTAILKKAFTFFENSFMGSSPARKYLESRNLDPQQIKAGYQNGTLHHGENKHLIESLEQIGLLKKINSGHAPFGPGSIVFPLKNKKDKISGLYFRAVEPRPGKFKDRYYEPHLYLKNRQGLYPCYPKPGTKTLLITESIIDCATLQQIPEITDHYGLLSSYGTNGITEEHRAAIKELKEPEEIIIFFDGDGAGREGARKAAEELQQLLPQVKISIVETPEGEDINSLSIGHEPGIFTELLQNRKPFSLLKETPATEKEKDCRDKAPIPTATTYTTKAAPEKGDGLLNTTNRPQGAHEHFKDRLDVSNPYKITFPTQTAIYHVKGGIPKALDSMKVTLEIEHLQTRRKSRQKIDLYEDKQTEKAAREAGEKLGIRADLIETDLNHLTDLLDTYRETGLMEKEQAKKKNITVPPQEQERCLKFLGRPGLVQRFNVLLGKAGITGEANNRIFLFVIASSYKMPDTLHALVQGSSGSGKTYLVKIVSDAMPPEDVIRLTRVTENSFYNYGEYELQYKLIVIEDIDGLKEEAEFAFRELQSNDMLSSSTSIKNDNGNSQGAIRIVRGPIGSMATTTRGEIYQDNMSRVFLIAVDESRQQTQEIINYQNMKATGKINKQHEEENKRFVQNCIRMLKPYEVVNPYADKILLPMEADTVRRLTNLFHAFIKQLTILHQYQRKKDQYGRLVTEKEDVKNAIDIMFESIVLKVDELDGSLRQFYERLKHYIQSRGEEYQNYQFTQREIRHALNIKKTRLSYFINELLELEYLSQSGGYANRGFSYKITYWDSLQALRERIKNHLYGQLEQL